VTPRELIAHVILFPTLTSVVLDSNPEGLKTVHLLSDVDLSHQQDNAPFLLIKHF